MLAASLLVERPLSLQGSTELIEDVDGWPTSEVVGGTETKIVAANSTGFQALIVIGRSDATVLNNVRIRGFVFQGSTNGLEVLLNRVQDFEVRANVFREPAFIGLQTVASSGTAIGNHFSGVGTGAALTRNTAALDVTMLSRWLYLHGATYSIVDPDGTLGTAWIDHPESDPFLGACPDDAMHESLGNVLIYNGVVMPNGRNF